MYPRPLLPSPIELLSTVMNRRNITSCAVAWNTGRYSLIVDGANAGVSTFLCLTRFVSTTCKD